MPCHGRLERLRLSPRRMDALTPSHVCNGGLCGDGFSSRWPCCSPRRPPRIGIACMTGLQNGSGGAHPYRWDENATAGAEGRSAREHTEKRGEPDGGGDRHGTNKDLQGPGEGAEADSFETVTLAETPSHSTSVGADTLEHGHGTRIRLIDVIDAALLAGSRDAFIRRAASSGEWPGPSQAGKYARLAGPPVAS